MPKPEPSGLWDSGQFTLVLSLCCSVFLMPWLMLWFDKLLCFQVSVSFFCSGVAQTALFMRSHSCCPEGTLQLWTCRKHHLWLCLFYDLVYSRFFSVNLELFDRFRCWMVTNISGKMEMFWTNPAGNNATTFCSPTDSGVSCRAKIQVQLLTLFANRFWCLFSAK